MPLKLVPPGKRKNNPNFLIRGTHEATGKYIERTTGTRNAALAEKKLSDLIITLNREAADGPQTTFVQAAYRYVEDGGEKRFVMKVASHLDGTLISDITPQVIDAAARALYPDALPETRHRQAVTPIKAILNHHERGGRKTTHTKRKRVRWLTPEDADVLLSVARETDPRIERITYFLLGTGCRPSELVNLHVENVNVATKQVYIIDPKNGVSRWVPVEPGRAWDTFTRDLPDSGPAFRTPKGDGYKPRKNGGGQFAAAFNKVRDLAGFDAEGPMKVTPYTLRHTWATWYYAATRHNLTALMQHGGWEDVRTPMETYAKLAPSDLAHRLMNRGWKYGFQGITGESDQGRQFYAV